MAEENILISNPNRFTVYPLEHEWQWKAYKKQVKLFWKPEDVKYSKDLYDWNNKLSEEERHFIKLVLAFFAASDGIVNENLAENFVREVQYTEAKFFYGFQMAMEAIHSESYSLMIDTFIIDKEEKMRLLRAIETIPAVKKKAEWALRWIGSTRDDFNDNETIQETIRFLESLPENQRPVELLQRLKYKKPSYDTRMIAMAAVEGIFFSSSFCAIYWLKQRNLMPALTFSNKYIARDEGIHCQFAIDTHKYEIENKLSEEIAHQIISEAVSIETEFVKAALPWRLKNMNADLMCQYVKYVADGLLRDLGYSTLWNVENPFLFMELISSEGKTNMFEDEISDYSLARVDDDPSQNVVRFDEPF